MGLREKRLDQTSILLIGLLLSFLMLCETNYKRIIQTTLQVCPRFGISLIKRVVNNFVPDEFSPGPIPDAVFDALNSEVGLFLAWLVKIRSNKYGVGMDY